MKRLLGTALAAALAAVPAVAPAQALPSGFVEIAPLPDPVYTSRNSVAWLHMHGLIAGAEAPGR